MPDRSDTKINWEVTRVDGEPRNYLGRFTDHPNSLPFASVSPVLGGKWLLLLLEGKDSMHTRYFEYLSAEKAMLHAEKWARPRLKRLLRFPLSRSGGSVDTSQP